MNPEQWGEVKRILCEAADLPEEEQVQFAKAVPADQVVTSEVLRLLESLENTDGFLAEPAADLHDYVGWESDEPFFQPGSFIARRFEIVRFLNRGGMGEVYSAHDADLNEAVALKTIRPDIASRPEVIERFKREVKHAREISHPNICRVHELFCHEFEDGRRVWLLSMELLSGQTLRQRIAAEGPLPPADVLGLTRQMVSGLGAAHGLGLVHRDFKSSNVMLVPGANRSTRAVITDFGLSLRTRAVAGEPAEPGMGTPGYMSPEQEVGGEVGPKADQYALGAVMCEMLTGALPRWSKGRHSAERLNLLPASGAWAARWQRVICRCLERDPNERFPAVTEVMRALEPSSFLTAPLRLIAAAALLLLLAGAGFLFFRGNDGCRICEIVQLTPDTDESESPSMARFGGAIAYSSDRSDAGNLDIFRQTLPGGAPTRLTRDPARDENPSIAPDGRWVAFRSERGGGGIYLTDAPGAERLLVAHGRNPQISPDGTSLLYWVGDPNGSVASGKVFRMPLHGGTPVQVVGEFADARFPVWSPDGRAILFSGCRTQERTLPGCSDWWIAGVDGKRIVETHALERLQRAGVALAQEDTGFWHENSLLFSGAAGGGIHVTLWAVRLDPATWQVLGLPKQLLDEGTRDLSPSVSSKGEIAYTRISGALHIYRIEKATAAADSVLSKQTDDADIDGTPFVSEGGRWLVFARGRGARRGVWIKDTLLSQETPLVSSGRPAQSPIINRTGTLVAYEQMEDAGSAIYVKDQETPPRRICRGCGLPMGWFDGDRAFFYRDGLPSHIGLANPYTGETRVVLEEPKASLSEANWSPVSELLLFTETRDDHRKLFAVRVPRGTGQADGPWIPIPDEGVSADHPRWSGDGRTIFYTSNKDGFSCIYGQPFSLEKSAPIGKPFAVGHFHNQRASIDNVVPRSFNLSVDGDSVYFNLGEQSSTIWTGALARQ